MTSAAAAIMAHMSHIWALMTKVNNLIKLLLEYLKKDAALTLKDCTTKVTRRDPPADCAGRSRKLHSCCSPDPLTTNYGDGQNSLQTKADASQENS